MKLIRMQDFERFVIFHWPAFISGFRSNGFFKFMLPIPFHTLLLFRYFHFYRKSSIIEKYSVLGTNDRVSEDAEKLRGLNLFFM